jgi:hypothetical protein
MKPYELLPTLISFALLILIAFITDAILHFLNAPRLAVYFGPVGVGFITISFIYSFRKRKIIKFGSMKQYLLFHEIMTWTGSLLILVHAGIHYNALLPWLATFSILLCVASGFTGRYLLGRAKETLHERKQSFLLEGLSEEDAEAKLTWEAISINVMKKWRIIHQPITSLFAGLTAFHILLVYMYGKGL